jgi:hypothetical protein
MAIVPKGSHMWRFLLAGLGTVGGLALLFLGSFRDPAAILSDPHSAFLAERSTAKPQAPQSPAPVAQRVWPPAQPTPAQPPDDAVSQRQREALQQLQDLQAKISQATQDTAALRAQADQARHDLEELRQQRAADEAAAMEQVRLQEQRDAKASQQRAADTGKHAAAEQAAGQQSQQVATQQAATQQDVKALPPASPAEARHDAPGPQQGAAATERQDTAEQAAGQQSQQVVSPPPQDVKAPQPPSAAEARSDAPGAQQGAAATERQGVAVQAPAQQNQRVEPTQEVRVLPPARTAVAAAAPPRPAQPAVKLAPTEPDAREAVLSRLRREAPSRSDRGISPRADKVQVAPDQPRVTSPRQRLMDARTALVAGRTDDARHLLEEAQVQLVFRPVSPSQDSPVTGSVAAGQVAEALSMLGAGDVLHAIRYINLAVTQADQGPTVATAAPPPPIGNPQPQRYGDGYNVSR